MGMLALLLALWALDGWSAPASAAPILIDRIVAVVDNQVILWSELDTRVRAEVRDRGASAILSPAALDSLRQRVLDEMIDEQVLVLKAEADSVQVDAAEIEEMLSADMRRIKGSMTDAQFQEMLKGAGLSERQLKARRRKDIRHQLLYRQMQSELAYRQHVTRRDVDQFRAAHRDTLPVLLSLSHINLKVQPGGAEMAAKLERLRELKDRVAAGEEFAALAREYSEDPGTAPRGGDVGCFKRGELMPEFEQAAFDLKLGEVSEPVLTAAGYHLIQVREKRENTVCASHILLRARTRPEDRQDTERRLLALRERALAGEDFAQLAREHSENQATARRGGLWDVYPRDDLPPFLAERLRGLHLGDITMPFFLDDGGHIVKVNDDQASLEGLIRQIRTAEAVAAAVAAHRQRLHVESRLEAELQSLSDDATTGRLP